jgi:hypothetical protein
MTPIHTSVEARLLALSELAAAEQAWSEAKQRLEAAQLLTARLGVLREADPGTAHLIELGPGDSTVACRVQGYPWVVWPARHGLVLEPALYPEEVGQGPELEGRYSEVWFPMRQLEPRKQVRQWRVK